MKNYQRRASMYAIMIAGLFALASCKPDVKTVGSVKLNKSALTLAVGAVETLTATVLPDDAVDKTVEWKSGDDKIATVTVESGKATVKAIAVGETTITATTRDGGGVKGECKVTVTANDPVETLAVTPQALEFAADDPAEKKVTVTTNARTWEAQPSDGWIKITKGEGEFTVKVEAYTATDKARTGTITVSAGGAEKKTVTVTQAAAVGKHTISLDLESLVFEAGEEGEECAKQVTVTTGAASWNASVACGWLTLRHDGKTLHVTANEVHFENEPRTAEITFTAGNAEPAKLTVTQQATPVKVFNILLWIAYDGNKYKKSSASFRFLVDDSDTREPGFWAEGFTMTAFAPLPENGSKGFTIVPGRYTIDETCRPMTCLPARSSVSVFYESHHFDELRVRTDFTSGYFDVSLSGDTYTITTNFAGKRENSDGTFTEVEHLRYKYVGKIDYSKMMDYSEEFVFSDIKTGTRQAFGYPFRYPDESKEKWEVDVVANSEDQSWLLKGGLFEPRLYLSDENIFLDGTNSLGDATVEGVPVKVYVRAFCVDGDNVYGATTDGKQYDYKPDVDRIWGLLKFDGTVIINGKYCPILVGKIGVTANNEIFLMSECYQQLKYYLFQANPAPSNIGIMPDVPNTAKEGIDRQSRRSVRDSRNGAGDIKVSGAMKLRSRQIKQLDAGSFKPARRKI